VAAIPNDESTATKPALEPSPELLSGYCTTANQKAIDPDEHENPSEWHLRCRAKDCFCFCHSQYRALRNMDAETSRARKVREQRGVKQNHYPGSPEKVGARADGKCKNGHEMTKENTGPGNTCRRCKVLASNRCKEKKAATAAKAQAEIDRVQ
jgi:hypothetical protein